jgi:hypothetical protein
MMRCTRLWLGPLIVAGIFFGSHALADNAPGSAPGTSLTTNASASIATGNTFQTVLAASDNRRSLTIQNNNATDSCWVFVGSGSATKATSILLLAGGSYTRYYPYIPADVIQATCATTADTLYVDTQ